MVVSYKGKDELRQRLNIRLTDDEKAQIVEEAEVAGLPMAELGRRRLFGRPIIAKADEVMLKECRRIGGLIKHTFNESKGVHAAESAHALKAITDYMYFLTYGAHKNDR